MEKVYSIQHAEIKNALAGLLGYKNLSMENKDVILKSLYIYSGNKIDFADALLIAYHQDSSNTILHPFDKKILKIISLK